ncbi:MAG: ribosome maturation factor RimM [Gammaproteobacteria bacterium]
MIPMGRVSGLFGVRGQVKVFSHTDPRDNILRYTPWYLRPEGAGESDWRPVEHHGGKRQGKTIVAGITGIEDRDAAAELIGSDIAVARSQLPPPGPGEYYWIDLEGMRVETTTGVELGVISHLFETGANDVIVVKGDRERLVPFIEPDVVKSVDFDLGLMSVDWDPDF